MSIAHTSLTSPNVLIPLMAKAQGHPAFFVLESWNAPCLTAHIYLAFRHISELETHAWLPDQVRVHARLHCVLGVLDISLIAASMLLSWLAACEQ